jgi:hypothetical protein
MGTTMLILALGIWALVLDRTMKKEARHMRR